MQAMQTVPAVILMCRTSTTQLSLKDHYMLIHYSALHTSDG